MKSLAKTIIYFIYIALFGLIITISQSCRTGYGCQSTENYKAKTDKHGNLSKERGESNLFSKKQRKKMKENNR